MKRYRNSLVLSKDFTFSSPSGSMTYPSGMVLWSYKGKYDKRPVLTGSGGWLFWIGHGITEIIPADCLKFESVVSTITETID